MRLSQEQDDVTKMRQLQRTENKTKEPATDSLYLKCTPKVYMLDAGLGLSLVQLVSGRALKRWCLLEGSKVIRGVLLSGRVGPQFLPVSLCLCFWGAIR